MWAAAVGLFIILAFVLTVGLLSSRNTREPAKSGSRRLTKDDARHIGDRNVSGGNQVGPFATTQQGIRPQGQNPDLAEWLGSNAQKASASQWK